VGAIEDFGAFDGVFVGGWVLAFLGFLRVGLGVLFVGVLLDRAYECCAGDLQKTVLFLELLEDLRDFSLVLRSGRRSNGPGSCRPKSSAHSASLQS
jgi:hypothetical protein